jgi:small Trp-rich protein
MYFLLIGLLLLGLKLAAVAPVAGWEWWWVLLPFGLAFLWWEWTDRSGYTKRKMAEKAEQRKKDRIEKQRDALRATPKKPR